MMKKQMISGLLVMFIVALVLTACNANNVAQDAENAGELPPVAVVKAREALAAQINIAPEEIPFGMYERAEWTDSCLGLGGPAEICATGVYPGWLAMFEVGSLSYEVHTDELGDIILIKE